KAGGKAPRGGDPPQPQLAVRQAARLARRLRRVPHQAGRREPPARSHRQVPAEESPMSKSILVVDDTRSMRKMVATVLQSAGYSVEEAGDGAEALEKAKTRVFDLVVTDHNMPRMDGVTLVRALRGLAEYDAVALIVLSTETGVELKAKGREAGATGWMAKPFDPAKMLDIVKQFIA